MNNNIISAYTISNACTVLGTYLASSRAAALDLMAQDAGYIDYAEAATLTDDPADGSHLAIDEWSPADAMTTTATDDELASVSDADIRALRDGAASAGDLRDVAIANWALDGDSDARVYCARRICDYRSEQV